MFDQFHDQVNRERQALGLQPLLRRQTKTIYDRAYPGNRFGDNSTATVLAWLSQRGISGDAAERVILVAVNGLQPQPGYGAAPGLPIIHERASSAMVNQEHGMSCAAACARQLLRDVGFEVSEATVRHLAGTTNMFGTQTSQGRLADALNQLDPRGPLVRWGGGAVPEPEAQAHDAILRLELNGSWVADMTFVNQNGDVTIHSILVDGLNGNAIRVRDPWGLSGPGRSSEGTEGVMFLGDFLRRWSGIATAREQ